MIIDGRKIANEIYGEIKRSMDAGKGPHLTVFTCAPNFETRKFLALKKKKADEVGITVHVVEFPATATTEEIEQAITLCTSATSGIVVQLPLPLNIDTARVLCAVPKSHDVDGLTYGGGDTILPPVVGAIAAIAEAYGIVFEDKAVVVVGEGRLVGTPAALWARERRAQVSVVTRESKDADERISHADILILGAGKPHFITPMGIKAGVAIFDAGTSESSGVLVGDADPACAEKASFFTPVPGGIGPITVAYLFKNLMTLTERRMV